MWIHIYIYLYGFLKEPDFCHKSEGTNGTSSDLEPLERMPLRSANRSSRKKKRYQASFRAHLVQGVLNMF